MLSLAYLIQELRIDDNEQQWRGFLDSTLSDDCDIRNLSEVMVYAVRLNKVCLVQELLRRKLPMSPIYVFEAVKARAKDVLESFFHNGWDINKPMSRMDPPIIT